MPCTKCTKKDGPKSGDSGLKDTQQESTDKNTSSIWEGKNLRNLITLFRFVNQVVTLSMAQTGVQLQEEVLLLVNKCTCREIPDVHCGKTSGFTLNLG